MESSGCGILGEKPASRFGRREKLRTTYISNDIGGSLDIQAVGFSQDT
jgi:hypothetical protein